VISPLTDSQKTFLWRDLAGLGKEIWEGEDAQGEKRTGVRTSAIVSEHQGHHIALFFTGHNHAGDNLKEVLAQRAAELGPPIQMCDALSHNTAGEFDTIVANCLGHARRRYVDVVENFPVGCSAWFGRGVASELGTLELDLMLRSAVAGQVLTFHIETLDWACG
jgi:hypothetical protein